MGSSARIAAAWITALALGGCSGSDSTKTGDEEHLDEGPALTFDEYAVLFTNPTCKLYSYGPNQPVVSNVGAPIAARPKDVYCTQSDGPASAARPESPQHKLIEWIRDPATTEIFFAYLSYSNAEVTKELCAAVHDRGVKVTFVLDSGTDLERANELAACTPANGDPAGKPTMLLRGNQGNIVLQHNKLFFVNPHSDSPRLAFSSGNMSSGAYLHHENWHFVTLPAKTFFAQAHLCLMEGLIDHGSSKGEYSSFIQGCKGGIGLKEERDIKTFFVPGEGGRATETVRKAIAGAKSIDIAVHRFTSSTFVKELTARLTGDSPAPMRFVADDDMYWAGHGQMVGDNEASEYELVTQLSSLGMKASFMETNDAEHLLHHNKYFVFSMGDDAEAPASVFAGAGNFSKAGFRDNFENFYYITIPEVVEAFQKQYEHVWNDLATAPDNMPTEHVLPEGN